MLDRKDLNPDPAEQFHLWFDEAKSRRVLLPESCTLSTAHLPDGRVSARVVLMKELDRNGDFVVYSNWSTSKKARDVKSNKWVSLTFFWKELERQVRVEGTTELLTPEESQEYFDTRPRKSRIGAWASPQSKSIHRHVLDELVTEYEKRFEGVEDIPCPPFWGGIRIQPVEWEFFQGRPNRVHDRFVYVKEGDEWVIDRIAA
jgi:pyridoxamine 5'-phosphate oxidase